jgi:sporulation protein YlmC with PRC-barrel domain
MRLTDLRHAKVKSLDGELLGRVFEVHCDGGKITALKCGPGGFFERLTSRNEGRRIPWECVRRISGREIVVTPDPPRGRAKPSASRSRQGTRRPTAPRSGR